MKQTNRMRWLLMMLLCSCCMVANAQITGPTTVCKDSTGVYFYPAATGFHYTWSTSYQGNITGTNPLTTTANVIWGVAGTGKVYVTGYDSTNNPVLHDSLSVTIVATPQPTITANVIVGCQNFSWDTTKQHEGNPTTGPPTINENTCQKVCENSIVTYTAAGLPTSTYTWNVLGGTIQSTTANTVTVLWGVTGSGSVKVTETNSNGCVGTKSICIEIIHKPHAHFYSLPDSTLTHIKVCLKQVVIFKDNSDPDGGSPLMSWFWNFGDGGTFTSSSSSSVTHQYFTPGSYQVTLVVTNACNCRDTFYMKVDVSPDEGVHIDCPSVVCEFTKATYTMSPDDGSCGSYLWEVIGGTPTPPGGPYPNPLEVTWDNVDSTGFGYVIFDASSCSGMKCPGKTVIKVPVIQQKGYIFGPTVACPYSQVLYSLPEWPSTAFNWTITSSMGATLAHTDQNNQIVIQTQGTEVVHLHCDYTNSLMGCSGIADIDVYIKAPETIDGPEYVCLNQYASYNMSGLGTADWTLTYPNNTTITFSGTTFNALFNMPGTYLLNATGSFCLKDPRIIKVDPQLPLPDSLLGPDTVCFGTPVRFNAKNPVAGSVFGWAAATGSLNAASGDHTYATFSGASPATIMVWREGTTGAHCHSDTLSKLVYRPYVPLNIAGTDTVCPSSLEHYTSGYAGGETYTWTIDAPGLGSVQLNGNKDVDVLWNNAAGFGRLILAMRKCDSIYRDTMYITIRNIPTLSISLSQNPVCRDVPVVATLLPSGLTAGSITWNWGDGTALTSGNPSSHPYTQLSGSAFNYTISVQVNNPYGCPDTAFASTSIVVNPAPVANVTPVGPFYYCTGLPNQPLTATLQNGYAPTQQLEWREVSTGLLTSCTGNPPACTGYNVTNMGNYYVIAIDTITHCADTSNIVTFAQGNCGGSTGGCAFTPTAIIDSTIYHCGSLHLHGSTSAGADAWSWTYPPQAQNVSTSNNTLDCTFGLAGLYTFGYIVHFTVGGNTCTAYDTATVLVPLIAGMGHTVTCAPAGAGYTVTLHDHSNYYPGFAPTGYTFWINGVPNYTTSPNFTTVLPAGAGYSFINVVHFTVNGNADSCYAYDTLYLPALPVANFSFARDTTCANQASVQFTNLSTPTSSPLSYLWDFGDGPQNTQTNPFKVYPSNSFNFWQATLTVTNQYGCSSSIVKNVHIIPQNLNGNLLASDSVACAGQSINILYNSSTPDYPEIYYWMNDLDTMYSNNLSGINVFSSGSYWVTGTNHFGCYWPTNKINVNIIEVPPAVITGDSNACIGTKYVLSGYAGSDPNIQYQWLLNGLPISGATSSEYTDPAAAIGTYTYSVIISVPNPLGGFCADTSAPFGVTVHSLPPAPYISFNITDCNAYTVDLTAYSSVPGAIYNWSNGMFGNPVTAQGGGPYRVWLTDSFGCVSHGDAYVPKDPTVYMWMFPTGCYQFCFQALPRTILGPINVFNYWAYLDGGSVSLDGYNSSVAPYSLTHPGVYNLLLNNGYCQKKTGDMDVSITDCPGCEQIDWKEINIVGYQKVGDSCIYTLNIDFFNNYPFPVSPIITVNTPNVGINPTGIFLPNGYTMGTFQLIMPSGWSGGIVTLTLSYTVDGKQFSCQRRIDVPPCGQKKFGSTTEIVNTNQPALMLVPNPAGNTTNANYQVAADGNARIEVYDITGRLITSKNMATAKGSWQISLNEYVSGIYVVVLKQNGSVILQQKLTVTH